MKSEKVVFYLEENSEFLFPNNKYSLEDIEVALLSQPDAVDEYLRAFSFRSPNTAGSIAWLGGRAWGYLFAGKFAGKGIVKTLFLMLPLAFKDGLFISSKSTRRKWKNEAKELTRQINCDTLMQLMTTHHFS